MYFFLSLLQRLSAVRVVFDFNTSLSDVAPVSPMPLSVDVKRKGTSELLMDVFCDFFLLSLLHRLSSVSVVFDFNASLNDDAPVAPMLLPVDAKRSEKE